MFLSRGLRFIVPSVQSKGHRTLRLSAHKVTDSSSCTDSPDFELIIHGETVPVHRKILSQHSEFFNKYLQNHEMKAKLMINDLPQDAVKKVINYMYTLEIPEGREDLVELIYTAHSLKVDSLKTFLLKSVKGEDVWKVLEMDEELTLNDDPLLKDRMKFMIKKWKEIKGTEKWKDFKGKHAMQARAIEFKTWLQ